MKTLLKSYYHTLLYVLILCGFLSTGEITAQNFSSDAPTGLTVEFIREPKSIQIIDSKPEFSWLVPQSIAMQKGYQILVASSIQVLDKDSGDVWDSGKVMSTSAINVELSGNPLKENTTYYWKVRSMGSKGIISPYSEHQEFTTGKFGAKITSSNFHQIEYISPTYSRKNKDGSYFIDFGKAAFATLNINYTTKKPKTLTIRLGEKLLNGAIDRNPGGTIRFQEVLLKVSPEKSSYQIQLVPDAKNTRPIATPMPPSFPIIMPFRYAEIVGASKNLDPSKQIQEAYFDYFNYDTSSFISNDTILNQVWDLCKYSIKATTFAGVYVDGDRERIPYEADAYLNQLSHYSVDNEFAIARKTIEYFFESMPTWPTEWQLHVAMMLYQDYMFTGNTELIEKYYERLKAKTLMALEVEDGFISISSPNHNDDLMASLGFPDTSSRLRDIVDWPPESNNFGGIKRYQRGEQDQYVFTRINTVVNAFYYHNMKIMAEFAGILNKPTEELDFELRAAHVKKSINDQLFNKEKGYYVDGIGTEHASLHANMFPLAFDLVPEEHLETVITHIKSRGMACSVYGAQYLMEALYKAGEENYALELMTATHDRSWYNMIKIGSTITLEAWDMKYKVNGDYNHAWGAVPANIIPRGLWGIQPKTAGYGLVKIQPQMSILANSTIMVPTIKGAIKGEFKQTENEKHYAVTLPPNMVGEFYFDSTATAVYVNDAPINTAFGYIKLVPGETKIVVALK